MQEARRDIGEKAQELVCATESIRTESKKKVSLGKRRLQEKDQLCESSRKTKKLRKERDETRKQLELKEQELHFLRQEERHQRESAELQIQAVIREKEAEIRFLKEKLAQMERELSSEREKNDGLCERLQQSTAELAKQCERVRGLERSRAELERERRRVDTRMIFEIARREVGIPYKGDGNEKWHIQTHTHALKKYCLLFGSIPHTSVVCPGCINMECLCTLHMRNKDWPENET